MKAKRNRRKINVSKLALRHDRLMEASREGKIVNDAKACKMIILDALRPQLESGFKNLKPSKALKHIKHIRELIPSTEKDLVIFNQVTAPDYMALENIDNKKYAPTGKLVTRGATKGGNTTSRGYEPKRKEAREELKKYFKSPYISITQARKLVAKKIGLSYRTVLRCTKGMKK